MKKARLNIGIDAAIFLLFAVPTIAAAVHGSLGSTASLGITGSLFSLVMLVRSINDYRKAKASS